MEKMIEQAAYAIMDSSPESSIYIGCDSIRFKKDRKWMARYSVVVVLHIDSKHGCKLFHHTKVLPDYGNLRQRLMQEVQMVTEVALELLPFIENRHVEIHIDINPAPQHKSSVALKEAIGYVMGMTGREPVLKPDAFAATHASDHVARHGYLH